MRSIGYRRPQPVRASGAGRRWSSLRGFYADDARSSLPVLAGQAARAGVTIYMPSTPGEPARGAACRPLPIRAIQGPGLSGVRGIPPTRRWTASRGGDRRHHPRNRNNFGAALDDAGHRHQHLLRARPIRRRRRSTADIARIVLKTKWAGLTVRARRRATSRVRCRRPRGCGLRSRGRWRTGIARRGEALSGLNSMGLLSHCGAFRSLCDRSNLSAPAPPRTFRSGAQIVEVDVRVLGKDGRFVTGPFPS